MTKWILKQKGNSFFLILSKVKKMKTTTDKSDAKRWLIIGAHQAGATDRQIAKMCGINQPAVRRIILNFKTSGSPFIAKGLISQKGYINMYIKVFFYIDNII
jgi:hypothetical protein